MDEDEGVGDREGSIRRMTTMIWGMRNAIHKGIKRED